MQAGQVEWSDELQFPLFVKPSNTDSSVGIDERRVGRQRQRADGAHLVHPHRVKAPVLIEEFIEGREIFVGVVDGTRPRSAADRRVGFLEGQKGPKFATPKAKWDK